MRSTRSWSEPARATALLAFVAATQACTSPLAAPIPGAAPDSVGPRRGGTLNLASIGDMRALDPAVTTDALAASAMELLFAGLVDYDANANIVPDLAERFEVSPDGTVYRFFLRHGALFHDGAEVTADDVKRSIERALHPSTPDPNASLYTSIAGYAAFTAGKADHLEGVSVEGRYVVSIQLSQRDARFLFALALQPLRPVCKSAGERYSDGWSPCGAGPFQLRPGGWDRGRTLTLVRHEGYFRPGKPYLDAVRWTFNVNQASEAFKFQDGELDSVRDLGDAEITRFLRDPRWKPYYAFEPPQSVTGESMNTEMPPFDNVEVRRAVAAAIDREHYRRVKPVSLVPATQVIPPSVPGYDPTFQGQTYDYSAALEHMRRAGYAYDPATDRGGWAPKIPYYAYTQGAVIFTAQVLQQELARIGLRLEIRLVNYPTFLALNNRRRTAPIGAPGWLMDYPDPSDFFDNLFASDAINDETSNNTSFYANPRLDAILARAHDVVDPRERYVLYGQANRIVCDDAPWAFTFFTRYFDVWQPYVHAFGVHPVWAAYAADAWIDRGGRDASRTLSVLWPAVHTRRGRR